MSSCLSSLAQRSSNLVLALVLIFSTLTLSLLFGLGACAFADSVNSPNVTLNVDTNRSTGAGAGNVGLAINTITVAETTLPEYSSGTGKSITLKVRPGFHFDSSSVVTAQSATIGFNGLAINAVASRTPTGAADETLTFNLTSGTNASVQDIIRFNGVKLKILNAAGAAGPAQTTMLITTSTAGGAFSAQAIVAANITRGAADRLAFSIEPGSNQAGVDLLPEVKIVDFGGNIVTSESRTVTLAIQTNPGGATLLGTNARSTSNGIAKWLASDDLRISTAASGYVLRASHSGASFLSSDVTDSLPFEISAGDPGGLTITTQPSDTAAGSDILISVQQVDQFSNPVTSPEVQVTIDSALNPGGWPLLVDSSLTKTTSSGVASWTSADHLRINKAVDSYRLSVSGLGAPVESDTFAINPASASELRFSIQPVDVRIDTIMTPDPAVEVIDSFGNRTNTAVGISLATVRTKCGKNISGNSATSSAGLASFNSLVLDVACEDNLLKASAPGLVGVLSEPFDVKAENSVPVAISSTELIPGASFKFSTTGSFTLPRRAIDDPTKKGAVLTLSGSSGNATINLGKAGWRKLGSKGFRFKGRACSSVLVKRNVLSANCGKKTGTLALPEEGPLQIGLKLGKGTAEFCGSCGGTEQGDATQVFQRSSCDAPSLCP